MTSTFLSTSVPRRVSIAAKMAEASLSMSPNANAAGLPEDRAECRVMKDSRSEVLRTCVLCEDTTKSSR